MQFADSINVAEAQELITQIQEKIGSLEKCPESDAIQTYWRNTVQYIHDKKEIGAHGFDQLVV